MDIITKVNDAVNGFVWGVPAMVCIIGVGLWLSFGTRFLQIRKFGYAMKSILGRIFTKEKAADGAVTPFQAVCTALAGTVGTGNIAGVAGAIAIGGPGAVFWMWISALLGMCTKFAEVTLAVHYREKNAHGDWVGGPMYYIKNGLSKKWYFLAVFYALLGILTVFGTGNATQVNTIVSSINSALINMGVISRGSLGINLAIGIVIAILVAIVLIGGVKRIGGVAEKLVPFMAVVYIVLGLGVVFMNIGMVPKVFHDIFLGAFSPQGITGGVIGSMFVAMKRGFSRGIFSNEAGLGTGSIAHAAADVDNPVKQGYFGVFEVFVDTIVICTLTALIVLIGAGSNITYGVAAGAELTIAGFTNVYGGWVSIITAIAMCCFAFSTILGWGLYGTRCIEFLAGSKVNKPFMVVYSLVAIIGATIDLGLLWGIADTFNGMMVIPNLIAIFLLSGTVFKLVKESKV